MQTTKQDLLNTITIKNLNIYSDINTITNFLVNNRHTILIPKEKTQFIFNNILSMSKSPLSEFFNIIKPYNLEYFAFLSTIDKSSVPNILLYKHLNIDINSLPDNFRSYVNVINSIPEYKNKIIINLLDFLNKKQDKILDVAGLYKIVNRTLCTRSYNNYTDIWISMDFVTFLTKVYSITYSSNISRLYNFNLQEQSILTIIFGYFFITRCINSSISDKLKLLSNFNFLGNSAVILDTLKHIDEILEGKPFIHIEDLLKVIIEISPKRLSKITIMDFLTVIRTFNYDNLVSIISFEFPGYFLFNIFCAVSGDRNNLFFLAKRTNLLKDMILFCNEILYNKLFIESFKPK